MSEWCNVCRARRADDDLEPDRRGNLCCPRCGTRLRSDTPTHRRGRRA